MVNIPIWNPKKITKHNIFDNLDEKEAFKHFRQSSSNFIAKKQVRQIVFNKSNSTCQSCGSIKNLQIDHIKSVRYCFFNGLIKYCNTLDNLQVLCVTCNTSKTP